ncbi:DUF4431 domain-containing protein [Proteus mirabilis]|uniref:DUF4431 domain-containing protein n=1 Tax=Proteus mirabilis TaxID=584 RepID=UPI0034D55DB4
MKKTAIGLLIFASFAVNSASFDCSKEPSKVGQLICNTPELSKMDDELYVDYLQAKLVTGNNAEFKKLVKQNWKLRQDNCETVECIADWYKRSTILYRNIANANASNNIETKKKNSNEYFYAEPVKLDGLLLNESVGFPSLRLFEIISVSSKDGGQEADELPEFGVGVTQLVITRDNLWDQFEKYKGKPATVTCGLFHAHTAQHKTPVMCNVIDISPDENQARSDDRASSNHDVKSSNTLDDFLKNNPELSNNIYIKKAIKDMAAALSLQDSFISPSPNSSVLRATSDGLKENGYEYGRLAIRTLQDNCRIGAGDLWGLRDKECSILFNYKD